ncbi:MAG: type II toxin-antitoxin system HicA family toxin [Nitrososphaeraceae archaeon]
MSLKNHNYRQILKVLTKYYGFSIERQSGSHLQLKHPDGRRLTVPRHDPIKIGVLKAIVEQAKTTQEEFLKYI